MKRSLVVCGMLIIGFSTVPNSDMCAAGELKETVWITLVESTNEVDRARGKRLAAQTRRHEVDVLLSILHSPVILGEEFWNPGTSRNIAIFILGHFRSIEAIPSLIEWLYPKEGQSMESDEEVLLSPAAVSLSEIGLPASKSLIEQLTKEGMSARGRMCLMAIVKIMGPDMAQFRVEKAIQLSTDARGRQKLTDCMVALAEHRIPVQLLWNPK